MLWSKFNWNWPSGSWEDFWILLSYFRYFVITSSWQKAWPFIRTNLNPNHARMLFAKFGWNWPSGSWEEDFIILSMYFRYLVIISPWKKGVALHLNKLESPPPKNALCQILLKFVPWFWRREFLNFVKIFSLFGNYLLLEKGVDLHLLENIEFIRRRHHYLRRSAKYWELCSALIWPLNWE